MRAQHDAADAPADRGAAVLPVVGRVGAALLGGYAITWGFAAFGIAALAALGADFHDGEAAVMMLAFLVYLTAFLWAFAARRLTLVWVVLAGGGAAMTGAAWALQSIILG